MASVTCGRGPQDLPRLTDCCACLAGDEHRHEGVVTAREVGSITDALPYIAMERLAGTTLAQQLERGLLDRAALRHLVVDACAALVVVMSPASEASPWVQLEVGRARNRRRSVYPILLSGTGLARLADIQYETVPPGETLPSTAFVERLRANLAASPALPR